jgi:hypothetical protein
MPLLLSVSLVLSPLWLCWSKRTRSTLRRWPWDKTWQHVMTVRLEAVVTSALDFMALYSVSDGLLGDGKAGSSLMSSDT